jgi:hypothetical protein
MKDAIRAADHILDLGRVRNRAVVGSSPKDTARSWAVKIRSPRSI